MGLKCCVVRRGESRRSKVVDKRLISHPPRCGGEGMGRIITQLSTGIFDISPERGGTMRAFLERWWYGREPILGIDIRDDGIVVADVDLHGRNRWRKTDASSLHGGGSGMLKDTHAFSSLLRDFISSCPTRIGRCAVGFPDGLTSISWVTLPDDIASKSEEVRYEAALERLYLRPQDVRGRVYLVKQSSAGSPNALLVAAKAADVALLEDGVALAGLELACLTPRVFALHHLVSLSQLASNDHLIAYSDCSSQSFQFHLFKGPHYHSSTRDFGELVREIERCVEGSDQSNGCRDVTFLNNGHDKLAALLQHRIPSARVTSMSELLVPGSLKFEPDQGAAAALSLWEARLR